MNEFEKMTIEELVGEAYDIGHAHGMNPFRMWEGRPPQRVDDGWGPIAEEIERRIREARFRAVLEVRHEWITAGLRRAAEIVSQSDGWDMHPKDYAKMIEAEAARVEGDK